MDWLKIRELSTGDWIEVFLYLLPTIVLSFWGRMLGSVMPPDLFGMTPAQVSGIYAILGATNIATTVAIATFFLELDRTARWLRYFLFLILSAGLLGTYLFVGVLACSFTSVQLQPVLFLLMLIAPWLILRSWFSSSCLAVTFPIFCYWACPGRVDYSVSLFVGFLFIWFLRVLGGGLQRVWRSVNRAESPTAAG